MENRAQDQRIRTAARAIDFWLALYVLLLAYHLVTISLLPPAGWWVPILLIHFRKPVRRGEKLKQAMWFSVFCAFASLSVLWGGVDGAWSLPEREVRGLLSFAGAQLTLSVITAWLLWLAYRHLPQPEPPERTPAQVARHRQLAGLVLLAVGLAVAALVTVGLTRWQETQQASNPLKAYTLAGLVAWGGWFLHRAVQRGTAVVAVSALILPLVILGMVGTGAVLLVASVGTTDWTVGLVFFVASSVATVLTMRAVLAGERKGQGDAG